MKIHLITKDQLDKDNYYIGSVNLSDFDGHLESEENLGYVKFKLGVSVKGYIWFRSGGDIEAGCGIEAGDGIKAGGDIKAGDYIEAGGDIKAGGDIEAGGGIKAGGGIECKGVLSFAKRLFAGISVYRDTSNEIKTIVCGKLEGGVVCYGDVTETGIEEEKVEATICDSKKEAIEKLEAALAILKA